MYTCLDHYRPLAYLRRAKPPDKTISPHVLHSHLSSQAEQKGLPVAAVVQSRYRDAIRCSFETCSLTYYHHCPPHKEGRLVMDYPSSEISLAHETTRCKEMNNVDRLRPQIPGHWPRPQRRLSPMSLTRRNIHAACTCQHSALR